MRSLGLLLAILISGPALGAVFDVSLERADSKRGDGAYVLSCLKEGERFCDVSRRLRGKETGKKKTPRVKSEQIVARFLRSLPATLPETAKSVDPTGRISLKLKHPERNLELTVGAKANHSEQEEDRLLRQALLELSAALNDLYWN